MAFISLSCKLSLSHRKKSHEGAMKIVIHLGPVVQSIVSLTSLLRGQLIKCFMTL